MCEGDSHRQTKAPQTSRELTRACPPVTMQPTKLDTYRCESGCCCEMHVCVVTVVDQPTPLNVGLGDKATACLHVAHWTFWFTLVSRSEKPAWIKCFLVAISCILPVNGSSPVDSSFVQAGDARCSRLLLVITIAQAGVTLACLTPVHPGAKSVCYFGTVGKLSLCQQN